MSTQKPLTEKRLENIALFYLERFDASSEKLRQVLNRRLYRQKICGTVVNPESQNWIENIIQKMKHLGFVNDDRYAENVVRRLGEQGKSARQIQQKLCSEGIDAFVDEQLLSEQDDLSRAKIFVRKKHLGQNYEKDLEKLARAGFNYETAKQALKEKDEDV